MLLPRRPTLLPVLFAGLLATALPAHAQAPAEAPVAEEGEAAATSPTRPSGAAFMQPLGRLSSILGSMHFLRRLCEEEDADLWRDKMNELIAAQNPNEADRRILISRFNGGYRAFESTYRSCTPAANVAIRRYLDEGEQLSRDIAARYGN
ncbi:TIGR02301 family protein [Aureimonas populi]|uniref:TIGR02301 family protein n=1 Tax=Aureimonas populi TaxID=1701758 RepID=A0ABW5CII0_9HYPH|nr:TIGR02301 family protein [Aureimonas populi]